MFNIANVSYELSNWFSFGSMWEYIMASSVKCGHVSPLLVPTVQSLVTTCYTCLSNVFLRLQIDNMLLTLVGLS